MSFSMYQASVPVFLRALTNLRAVLQKGEAFAADKGFESSVLLNSRLIADMFPLTKQVQIATDMAVRGSARLAGTEPPSFPDTETDFAGLYARIDRAIEVVRGLNAAQFDGSETRMIDVPRRGRDPLRLDGQSYLLHYLLPNLFFHCTTTYAILREAGVALGKDDFMGAS
jgi:hypothetical protein